MKRAMTSLALLSASGASLVAGVFFAFSTFIMAGLARLPAPQGIAAMQSINITVINPVFMSVFFGTALLSAAVIVTALMNWSDPRSLKLLAGALLYIVGAIGVTLIFNVPLNDGLATAVPDSPDSEILWARYITVWTGWNHVRGVAALAAAALFIWGWIS